MTRPLTKLRFLYLCSILVLSFILSFSNIPTVSCSPANPIEVENYTSRMLENTQQYRVHYDSVSGRDYVFYAYGNLVAYKHKLHSETTFSARITGWSPSSASGYSLVNNFDIYFDGNWLYMVFNSAGTGLKAIYFRRGTFNSDGTIAWSAVWKAVGNFYSGYFPTIMHDGNRVYLAYHHYDVEDTPPYQFYVYRSTDGLAGQSWTGPHTIPTSGGTGYPAGSNRLLKCNSGIALVYGEGTGKTCVVFSSDQGASWSSPVSFSETVYLGNGRAVAIDDMVHLCYFFRGSPTYQFRHRKIAFNGASWSAPIIVKDSGVAANSITITAFKKGSELQAIYLYTPFSDTATTDPIWFRYTAEGWDSGTNLNVPQYAQWYPNTDREANAPEIPVIWARKIYASPYYVEFLNFVPTAKVNIYGRFIQESPIKTNVNLTWMDNTGYIGFNVPMNTKQTFKVKCVLAAYPHAFPFAVLYADSFDEADEALNDWYVTQAVAEDPKTFKVIFQNITEHLVKEDPPTYEVLQASPIIRSSTKRLINAYYDYENLRLDVTFSDTGIALLKIDTPVKDGIGLSPIYVLEQGARITRVNTKADFNSYTTSCWYFGPYPDPEIPEEFWEIPYLYVKIFLHSYVEVKIYFGGAYYPSLPPPPEKEICPYCLTVPSLPSIGKLLDFVGFFSDLINWILWWLRCTKLLYLILLVIFGICIISYLYHRAG